MAFDQEKAIETVRGFVRNQEKLDESKREEPPPQLNMIWQALKFIADCVNMAEEQSISLFYDQNTTSLNYYFDGQTNGVNPTEAQIEKFSRQLDNLWTYYLGIIKTVNSTLKNGLPV